MKAWSVSDKWYEMQVAVIAETRSQAKTIGRELFYDEEWIDLRATIVKSPIPIEGPPRIIDDINESLWYGFHWNNETMADAFGDEWFGSWLCEQSLF